MVHMNADFVGQRSSRSKWLKKYHEVALAMNCIVATWIQCIFLNSQILPKLCKKCYIFAVSDNLMCTTSRTTKFHSFCIFFKWRGELLCGVQIS